MDIGAQVAARVREERLKKSMTQEQLALKTGFDRTYISLIEQVQQEPSLTALAEIAHAGERSSVSRLLSLPRVVLQQRPQLPCHLV